jgi:tetratricopeptide (TPR) repeat protein
MSRPSAIPKPTAKTDSIAATLKEASLRLERLDFGSALQLYRQALAAQPSNAAAAMGLAMAFNRTGQPADALELLRKVWKAVSAVKPKMAPEQQAAVLAQLGLAQQQLGKLDEALESYRQAARLAGSPDLVRRIKQLEPLVSSPLPVQQLVLQARQLQGQRQLQEAAKTFRAALQLQQDSAEALHGLAMVLRELKAPEEALPLLQRAAMLMPDRPEFFNDLGLLFQDRSDFAKAASFHKRAVKLDPGFVFAYVNLGVAHKRLGQLDESVAAYRKALKINPRSPEAHNNLGNLLRTMGELALAKTHLEQALALRPGYTDAQANLDIVLQGIEQEREATKAAKKGVAGKSARAKPAVVKPGPVARKPAVKKPAAKKPAAKKPAAKKATAKKPAPQAKRKGKE